MIFVEYDRGQQRKPSPMCRIYNHDILEDARSYKIIHKKHKHSVK